MRKHSIYLGLDLLLLSSVVPALVSVCHILFVHSFCSHVAKSFHLSVDSFCAVGLVLILVWINSVIRSHDPRCATRDTVSPASVQQCPFAQNRPTIIALGRKPIRLCNVSTNGPRVSLRRAWDNSRRRLVINWFYSGGLNIFLNQTLVAQMTNLSMGMRYDGSPLGPGGPSNSRSGFLPTQKVKKMTENLGDWFHQNEFWTRCNSAP